MTSTSPRRPAPLFTSDDAPLVTALRVVIVVLAATSEAWNIANMIRDGERASEHFAYFTIHSVLLVLAVTLWMLAVPERRRPAWFDALRAGTVMYIVMTGLVYALLVAEPGEVWSWDIAYTNLAQHRLLPWLVAIDWLLVSTVRRLHWSLVGWLLVYPILYLVAAQLRGPIDGWYPYPFMDPTGPGGFVGILWPIGQVILAFLAGAALIVGVGRWRWGLERTIAGRATDATGAPANPSAVTRSE